MHAAYGDIGSSAETYEIQSLLGSDERLLWSGKPAGGVMFQPSDIILIPFSLMWCGFAIFWESIALSTTSAPLLFKLWGLPFVLAGLYMVAGRFVADAWQRAHTFYGLTNERVIILTSRPGKNVQSILLRTLTDINLKTGREGRGTITFGSSQSWMPIVSSATWPGSRRYFPPTFQMIPNATEVYDLIRHAQAGSGSGANTRPF